MEFRIGQLGLRRSANQQQNRIAAEAFEADDRATSLRKQIIDPKEPTYKEVVRQVGIARRTIDDRTMVYPKPGQRLVKRENAIALTEELQRIKDLMKFNAQQLDDKRDSIIDTARNRLKGLFDINDYPASFAEEYDITWEFLSAEPPAYLKVVAPELYRQQEEVIKTKFAEALFLMQQEVTKVIQETTAHLIDVLKGLKDGTQKRFYKSYVTSITDVVERFKQFDLGSHAKLTEAVDRLSGIVGTIDPDKLKEDVRLQDTVAKQLAELQPALEALTVDMPTRVVTNISQEWAA